jgi:hypothetical protein
MKFLKAIISLSLLSLTLAAPSALRRGTGDVSFKGVTTGDTGSGGTVGGSTTTSRRQSGGDTGTGGTVGGSTTTSRRQSGGDTGNGVGDGFGGGT